MFYLNCNFEITYNHLNNINFFFFFSDKMFDLNVDLTTNLVNLSQNNKNCKLLNIEDLIYHSREQYLILCLKICNLIIKYKCNINTLIDINKYKHKQIHKS